jgi:Vacuolar 14 Fab1-binding region
MKNRRESSNLETNTNLQSSILKLSSLDTLQKGLDEIKSYLIQAKRSDEKIAFFLSILNPSNEHMLTQNHKKELIKLYGVIAEMLEEACIPYLPKIFSALLKKLKEANPNFNEVISHSYGVVVHNTLHTLPDLQSSCSQLTSLLNSLFEILSQSNKILQVGAGLSITKIIQHSPLECLRYLLDKISMKLIKFLPGSKAQTQIIESLISTILSVEQDYSPYTAATVPELLNCISSDDFSCRKQVLDALYTLGAVVPSSVVPFASEILSILNNVRTDKIKPVRDSAVEAINLYKKLQPDSPPKPKIELQSPKEESKPKSIFKGPVNTNFFKAAKNLNNDSLIEVAEKPMFYREVPEKPIFYNDFQPEYQAESPRTASPSFREPETSRIEKFGFEESVQDYVDAGNKFKVSVNQYEELKSEFYQYREQTKSELYQMNLRLGALEEMISTVTQLFEAKIKQITCNPNIANLLRN